MSEEILLLEEEKEFKRFYRFSVWFVAHRAFLRRVAYGLLIGFDAVLLLFVLWTFLDSFAVSYTDDQREVAKIAVLGQNDLRAYTVSNAGDPIVESPVRVFSLGNGRTDFYTELSNPNTDWWVEFSYSFVHESGATQVESGFLLPSQTKPVIALAVQTQSAVREANLVLSQIKWHRVDRHVISDYQAWQDQRLNFKISDAVFTKETGFEKETFGRTQFTVFNNTAFGYYSPRFYVMLKRGSAVVGINQATVASLGPGETTEVVLNWFGTIPSVSSVEVIADVAVFNASVYMPLEGSSGIDTRTRVRQR